MTSKALANLKVRPLELARFLHFPGVMTNQNPSQSDAPPPEENPGIATTGKWAPAEPGETASSKESGEPADVPKEKPVSPSERPPSPRPPR